MRCIRLHNNAASFYDVALTNSSLPTYMSIWDAVMTLESVRIDQKMTEGQEKSTLSLQHLE